MSSSFSLGLSIFGLLSVSATFGVSSLTSGIFSTWGGSLSEEESGCLVVVFFVPIFPSCTSGGRVI